MQRIFLYKVWFVVQWLAIGNVCGQWTRQTGDWAWGAQAGISCTFGTHVNRIGLTFKGFVNYDFAQLNFVWLGNYTFKSLAANQRGLENQLRLGGALAWGRRDTLLNPYLHECGQQTGRRYAVAYSCNWYNDGWRTNQRTGTISFQAYDARLAMENDFLSFIAQDRYRTGAASVSYWVRATNTMLNLQHISWTGDPYGVGSKWISYDTLVPALFGYLDMYEAPYGRYSAGIAALSVEQLLPYYYQTAHASLGWDAERIRNFMQNELIHDSPLMPIHWVPGLDDSFRNKNPHVAMITSTGEAYTYRPHQKLRKPQLYGQLGLNGGVYY